MANTGKIFKLIGLGFLLATLMVALVGLLLPDSYTIERTVVIEAEPQRVHAVVGDFERWPDWAPWLRDDPSLEITLGAISSGPGASQTWQSETGGGIMTTTRSQPDWGVEFEMTLGKKEKLSACSLRYRVITQGTELVWQIKGNSGWNLFSRYFNLLLDPLMGPILEEGLQNIKVLAEEESTEA